MKKPIISIIAAVAENLAIGKDNRLLWNIPEDLQHFKKITSGHPVIMGERTYYSIGRPLPNRTNIVLTDKKDLEIDGVSICHSIEEAVEIAKRADKEEIFFIGGGMVYKQALPIADKLYLTIVEGEFEADTFFPEYKNLFKKIIRKTKHSNEKYNFRFVELIRE
ncbi:MAG: dihydrofolate reductase [bacterium]|nr:dihydrofolate reductase [bacterium]